MQVEGVAGEFDHFAIDLAHRRLYLAAEDQKTVEVFDLTAKKHIGSISLFARPHGLVFFPKSSRLIVADGGDGTVKFIDMETRKISSQIKTALRADSVAFDPASDTEVMFVMVICGAPSISCGPSPGMIPAKFTLEFCGVR